MHTDARSTAKSPTPPEPGYRRIVLDRSGMMAQKGRQFVSDALAGCETCVPDGVQFDIALIAGEALSNALLYGDASGKQVVIHAFAQCRMDAAAKTGTRGVLVMVLNYRSRKFNDRPPPAPKMQVSGRGIGMIRTFTAEGGGRAEWRFRGCDPVGMLTVVLVKKW